MNDDTFLIAFLAWMTAVSFGAVGFVLLIIFALKKNELVLRIALTLLSIAFICTWYLGGWWPIGLLNK